MILLKYNLYIPANLASRCATVLRNGKQRNNETPALCEMRENKSTRGWVRVCVDFLLFSALSGKESEGVEWRGWGGDELFWGGRGGGVRYGVLRGGDCVA